MSTFWLHMSYFLLFLFLALVEFSSPFNIHSFGFCFRSCSSCYFLHYKNYSWLKTLHSTACVPSLLSLFYLTSPDPSPRLWLNSCLNLPLWTDSSEDRLPAPVCLVCYKTKYLRYLLHWRLGIFVFVPFMPRFLNGMTFSIRLKVKQLKENFWIWISLLVSHEFLSDVFY